MILLLTLACADPDTGDTVALTGSMLVADTGHGRLLLVDRATGELSADICLATLLPDLCSPEVLGEDQTCLMFGSRHSVEASQDVLTFTYGLQGGKVKGIPGGVAKAVMGAAPEIEWKVDRVRYPDDAGLDTLCETDPDGDLSCKPGMPHMIDWMPDGETMVVADTWNLRVAFLQRGEDTDGTLIASIDLDTPGNPGVAYPNAVQVLPDGDTTRLLVTYKGVPPTSPDKNQGRILLWDITDLANPVLDWAYPEEGYLAAVHSGVIDDGVLLYAHAFGDSTDAAEGDLGTVGVATVNLPDAPVYVGDLRSGNADDPWGFVRHVSREDDGSHILVTDSGCENEGDAVCGRPMRVQTVAMPTLDAAGLSGSHSADHAQQVFLDAEPVGPAFDSNLSYPFSAEVLGEVAGSFAGAGCAR